MDQNKSIGSKVEAECIPTGGTPGGKESVYTYSLCFQLILATNQLKKDYQLCKDECCQFGSNRKFIYNIEFYHRGNYWCRALHESDLKLERNSTVKKLEVECMSSIVKIV